MSSEQRREGSVSRRFTMLATGAVLICAPAIAQLVPAHPSDGFLTPAPIAGPEVFDRCVTGLEVGTHLELVDLGCSVVESSLVGTLAGSEVWMLEYRRDATVDYKEFVDELAIDELVLIRQRPEGRGFDILWHLPQDRTYTFLEQVESVEIERGLLVSYLICLNGTGGCTQEFLFGEPDGWAVVDQPYLEDLAALVPAGWRLHKGRKVHLATMAGVQPIARPEDANCCPSGEMLFEVELVDRALRLKRATVAIPASDPEPEP